MAVDREARNMVKALESRVTAQATRIKALEDLLAAGTGAEMVAKVGAGVAYASGQLTVQADTVIGLVE